MRPGPNFDFVSSELHYINASYMIHSCDLLPGALRACGGLVPPAYGGNYRRSPESAFGPRPAVKGLAVLAINIRHPDDQGALSLAPQATIN